MNTVHSVWIQWLSQQITVVESGFTHWEHTVNNHLWTITHSPPPPVRNIVDDILCLDPYSEGNIFIIHDRMQNIKNSSLAPEWNAALAWICQRTYGNSAWNAYTYHHYAEDVVLWNFKYWKLIVEAFSHIQYVGSQQNWIPASLLSGWQSGANPSGLIVVIGSDWGSIHILYSRISSNTTKWRSSYCKYKVPHLKIHVSDLLDM